LSMIVSENRRLLFGVMLHPPYTREFRGDCGGARF
jgi:hypothetical protein